MQGAGRSGAVIITSGQGVTSGSGGEQLTRLSKEMRTVIALIDGYNVQLLRAGYLPLSENGVGFHTGAQLTNAMQRCSTPSGLQYYIFLIFLDFFGYSQIRQVPHYKERLPQKPTRK